MYTLQLVRKLLLLQRVVRKLEEHGAMDNTIVVAATASDPASMQYLAAFAGVQLWVNTSVTAVKMP